MLGSPALDAVTIRPGAGKPFTVRAVNNSPENVYIQSAKLNGKPFSRIYLTHSEILKGGLLTVQMGPKANEQWGSWPEDGPPALSPN